MNVGFLRRLRHSSNGGHDAEGLMKRVRAHLDPDQVVATVVEEISRTLRPDRVSLWLTTGEEPPRRVASAGRLRATDALEADDAPAMVRGAARRRRSRESKDPPSRAVPVVAPQSGLLGVLLLEGELTPAARRFLDQAAREAGYALESANLYEQAVAEKERTEAILGRVGDAVVVTDSAGTVLQWNQPAEWFFGRSGAEAARKRCGEVLGLHVGERALDCSQGCALLAAAGEGDTLLGIEAWRTRADGRRQPLSINVSGVIGPDGAAYEVVHSLRDITRLKEADEAKTMFLATASHELRTPLTVIQGFAQMLSSFPETAGEERAEALAAIERRALQLNRIVERLLLSSRIEAGRAEVYVSTVDLEPLLRSEAEAIAATTARDVVLEVDEALPKAMADPDGITTIIQHVLDNAVKYSPQGKAVIVHAEADDHHVLVSVTDEGIGMDAEQTARCFERFWQAESSDVRRFGGTGIGLYIVRSLAEAMGGSVAARSTPGEGSTFTVTLPRADAPVPAPQEPGAHDAPEPSVIREFMRQIGIPQRS